MATSRPPSEFCSDEVIADFSAETLAKLQLKHPAEYEGISYPPMLPPSTSLQVGEEDIFRAICFFPAGSSGGPDGLRPQHLIEMVQSREAGPGLLLALTQFTNILLQGRCHPAYQNIIFGGRLIALNKKSEGIQPCHGLRLA